MQYLKTLADGWNWEKIRSLTDTITNFRVSALFGSALGWARSNVDWPALAVAAVVVTVFTVLMKYPPVGGWIGQAALSCSELVPDQLIVWLHHLLG